MPSGNHQPLKLALVTLFENQFMYPPLGLMRIASYIKQTRESIAVKIIDSTYEDIDKEIKKFNPDVIGISTYTIDYQRAIDFSRKSKKDFPERIIVAGGPHIATLPKSLDKSMDYGMSGQGEIVLLQLLDAIKNKKPVSKIKGLIYRKNKKIISNGRADIVDFDKLAKMDYTLINKNYFKAKYAPETYDFKKSLGMVSSNGCPFNCLYCSIRAFWGNIKFRDLDVIVNQLKDLYYNHNIRHIDFYDDLFTINKERLRNLRDKLKKIGILGKITFSCTGRTDMMDDEMLEILKELNIVSISFGFESNSTPILQYIKNNKSLSAEKNEKAILLCKKHKIDASGSLMLGLPTEKIKDMKKTIEFIDFAKRNGASRIGVNVLVPYPATKIWEIAKQRGKLEENTEDIDWGAISWFNEDNPKLLDDDISLEEFIKLYKLSKKKCRHFVYKIFIKTILNNPKNLFYFVRDSKRYLHRFIGFVKQ